MKEGLIKAWQIHNEKNLLLIKHLDESTLNARSNARGRTVREQLSHLHNTRISWTEHVAKLAYDKALLIAKDASPGAAQLAEAFSASSQKIEEVIHLSWDKEGKLPSFKTGLLPFITYLVSHESHHRGQIVLTLKLNNTSLPNEVKWGLWEWGRLG